MKNNQKGFSVVEGILILVVFGLVGFAGWYVYQNRAKSESKAQQTSHEQAASEQANDTTSTKLPANFVQYENRDYGLKFQYPKAWGSPTIDRAALNNEKYEQNLPYRIKFVDAEAPTTIIIPSDWKFTSPGASEWNSPVERKNIVASNEGTNIRVVVDSVKAASITFSGFDHTISITGVKQVDIPKMKATQVELHKVTDGDGNGCLVTKKNSSGSEQEYATLSCYSKEYRDNFVQLLGSFEAL